MHWTQTKHWIENKQNSVKEASLKITFTEPTIEKTIEIKRIEILK